MPEITIELKQPSGTFLNELGLLFVAPIPQDTPNADDPAGLTNEPPPSAGACSRPPRSSPWHDAHFST